MLKRRIGALIGAFALLCGALVVTAAPAHAATTPQFQLPWEVSFSPEKPACDGAVTVDTTNNLDERTDIGLTFKVNNTFVNVDPETTESTVVNYPDSQDITVKLVGLYDAGDEDEFRHRSRRA